jgi:hypothetical protein
MMTIKRYNVEIHESHDWADAEEHPEGELVYVDEIRERLEYIASLMGGCGVPWLVLDTLIEELK